MLLNVKLVFVVDGVLKLWRREAQAACQSWRRSLRRPHLTSAATTNRYHQPAKMLGLNDYGSSDEDEAPLSKAPQQVRASLLSIVAGKAGYLLINQTLDEHPQQPPH